MIQPDVIFELGSFASQACYHLTHRTNIASAFITTNWTVSLFFM